MRAPGLADALDPPSTIEVGTRRDDLAPPPLPRASERLAEVVVDRVRRGLREHERTRSSQRLLAAPRSRGGAPG